MDCGGGQVVSVLAFYLLRRSKFESCWRLQFFYKICVWKEPKINKKRLGLTHLKKVWPDGQTFCSIFGHSRRWKFARQDVLKDSIRANWEHLFESHLLNFLRARANKTFSFIVQIQLPKKYLEGSGCGSVGGAVTFDTRDLRFESSHQPAFIKY